jgi:hypothetical protein
VDVSNDIFLSIVDFIEQYQLSLNNCLIVLIDGTTIYYYDNEEQPKYMSVCEHIKYDY